MGLRRKALGALVGSVARHDRVAGYDPLYSANETARWAHYAPALPVGRAKGS